MAWNETTQEQHRRPKDRFETDFLSWVYPELCTDFQHAPRMLRESERNREIP